MSKLLLFVLLGVAIYLWMRAVRRAQKQDAPPQSPSPQPIVACAQCGVHVPQSDSLMAAGQHYCCEQHREQGCARATNKR